MKFNEVFTMLRHSSHIHVSGTNLLEEECDFGPLLLDFLRGSIAI